MSQQLPLITGYLTCEHSLVKFLLNAASECNVKGHYWIRKRFDNIEEKFLKLAAAFMLEFGIVAYTWDNLVEYHEAHSYGTKPVETGMRIHLDDYTGCNFRTYTLIIYAGEYTGGELGFYNHNDELVELVDTRATPGKYCFVIFRGDIPHNANKVIAGKRHALSIQLPRIKKA